MCRVVMTIVAALIPSVAFAQCDALGKFMSKWTVNKSAIIYSTHDVSNHLPVYVLDLGSKAANPEQRYAIAWVDESSCTTEAIFRDQSGMMLAMEQQVYDIDQ